MLARSTTECYSKLRLSTLPLLRLPAARPRQQPSPPRCCPTPRTRLRFQSSFSTPENDDQTTISSHNEDGPSDTSTVHSYNIPPPPPPPVVTTTLHSSLPTFLAHAHRTSLSLTSPTYIGTHYEYTVAHTLRRLGFNLSRTGGRGDAGIDLLGTWHLPHHSHQQTTFVSGESRPLRVLVQCKALKAKLGPNLIRELEGAFVGAPAGYRGASPSGGVVGVLVGPREATKGVRDAMGRSRWPMVWVMLEVQKRGREERPPGRKCREGGKGGEGEGAEEEGPPMEGLVAETEGRVRQILWNRAAGSVGLDGLDVVMRYDEEGKEGLGGECVLMWQGRPVPGLDEGRS